MAGLKRFYKWVSILSLDVALGASVSAWFLARIAGVELLPQGLVVLAISVWIIYTADHLFDAMKVKRPAASDRHRFHQRHFNLLMIIVVVVLIVDLALVFFVRKPVVKTGFYLSLLVGLYIVVSSRLLYTKELAGALLYTAGVWLPSWTLHTASFSFDQGILVLLFFLVVLINLLLFSWLSFEEDLIDQQRSLTTTIGTARTRILLMVAFGIFAALVFVPAGYVGERAILAMMMLALAMIFIFHTRMKNNDLFRWIGDGVFLLPALLLF